MDAKDRNYLSRARSHRSNREFNEAGEFYTLAAYKDLSAGLPGRYGVRVARGLSQLLRAALCYRLAGTIGRCQNRSQQGVLIAEDMIDRVFSTEPESSIDQARRGVWYEYVGDFRMIGGFGVPDDAYDDAIDVYSAAGDPDTFEAEQEQVYLMNFYRDIVTDTAGDPGLIDDVHSDLTFVGWVQMKRDDLEEHVSALAEQGIWGL